MLPLPALILLQAPQAEAQKIESLIRAVADLKDATFLRNGSEHSAQAAGQHLRLKLRKAGKRVNSASDFIRACGSASSSTGEPYRIRFRDGRTVLCSDFLWTELKRLEAPGK